MKNFKFLTSCFVCAVGLTIASHGSVAAADKNEGSNAGSMDSVWSDRPPAGDLNAAPTLRDEGQDTNKPSVSDSMDTAEPGDKPIDKSSDKPTSASVSPSASAAVSIAPSAVLCPIDTFLSSGFVTGVGWPGVGPFRSAQPGPYTLIDNSKNRLGLSVDENKVVSANLELSGLAGPLQNFISMEMNTDFLLEALGAKASKISEFNTELEKNVNALSSANIQPLSIDVLPFSVLVDRSAQNQSGFRVRVSDKAIVTPDKVNIAMAAADNSTPPVVPSVRPTIKRSSQSSGSSQNASPQATSPKAEEEKKYADLLNAVTSDTNTPDTPANERGIAGVKIQRHKKEFVSLLNQWQTLKKSAVKNRSTTELSQALTGEALKRQTGAIEFLQHAHKYFEMTPKGVSVSLVEEKVPDHTYLVHATVKEGSKLVDEATKQVVKENDDVYNVVYEVELVGDQWLISDSHLVTKSPTSTSNAKH